MHRLAPICTQLHLNASDSFSPLYPAEEITFVGYPSDDGCGSFFNIMNDQVAVSATSSPEKQKGAWEFIRMLVSYECQYGNGFSGMLGNNSEFALPINKKAFEDMGRDQYSHEDEKVIDEFAGQEISDIYLTKSEYQKLFDFIRTIKKVNIGTERDIYEIINDEIFAFLQAKRLQRKLPKTYKTELSFL